MVSEVEIHWPSGVVEKMHLPNVDRIFTVQEGKGITGELCAACQTASAAKKTK